jgi:hypothetical protein
VSLLDDLLQTTETGGNDPFAQKPSPTSPPSRVAEAKKSSRGLESEADRIARPDAERKARDRATGRGIGYATTSDAATWRQGVTPHSRNPLIPDGVRSLIEGIEADARAQGWPAELLWNAEFWGSPRGLAAVLDESDAVDKVTSDYIEILKTEGSILRFQRSVMKSSDTVSTMTIGRT